MAKLEIDCKKISEISIINNNEMRVYVTGIDKEELQNQINEIFTLKELLKDLELSDIFEAIGETKIIEYIETEKSYLIK